MRFLRPITTTAASAGAPAAGLIGQSRNSLLLICPLGFSRFHIIDSVPALLNTKDFSPFSPRTIRRSAYPYLPRNHIPEYKPSEVERKSLHAAQMLYEEKWNQAYTAYHQILQLKIAKYGDPHGALMLAKEHLAGALLALGRLREARDILSEPMMNIGIDCWYAYRTARATLDFLLNAQGSAFEQLRQQFPFLDSPVHPTAFNMRFGRVVVANNLGVVARHLRTPAASYDYLVIANKWAEKLLNDRGFADVVASNLAQSQ
jgi:hypothetical protein